MGRTAPADNNLEQLETVRGMAEQARQKGATVREVGSVPDRALFRAGYFHRPTVVTDADPELDVVAKEQFGPLMPIIPFGDENEAVRMANCSKFGLCSSVWTPDKDRAIAIARRLEAGYTYLNAHGPAQQDNRCPFGGFKESGLGRNLGYEGILEFMEYHSITGAAGTLF